MCSHFVLYATIVDNIALGEKERKKEDAPHGITRCSNRSAQSFRDTLEWVCLSPRKTPSHGPKSTRL